MGGALIFALAAALSPTLLTATMVMLFAAEPRRLMGGYLLGAYTTSISLGLVIVFALEGTGAVKTTQHTLSPAADIAVGALFLLVAAVAHSERDARVRSGRARRRAAKTSEVPRWRRALDRGSPRDAFLVGIVLTLPGASFIVGMTRISEAGVSTPLRVLAVIVFCMIMLTLIEVPLVGYALRPELTRRQVTRFTGWVTGNARMIVTRLALVLGVLLLLRAAITLLT